MCFAHAILMDSSAASLKRTEGSIVGFESPQGLRMRSASTEDTSNKPYSREADH
jgi:hypothetical protein